MADKAFVYRTSIACMSVLFLLVLLIAGAQSPASALTTRSVSRSIPASYTSRIVEQAGAPDDLAFNPSGRLIFTSAVQGKISRLNADGSVALLFRDFHAPEGIVVLAHGTKIFAEQSTNRIVSLAPGATTTKVLRVLPGTLGTGCKLGVDGIALDRTTNTLIVPDSPTGAVYRMSLDGKTPTLLASGLARPVGAGVDSTGKIYVADECGGAIWTITPGGGITRMGGFGSPDDVVAFGSTTVFLIDLATSVHALIKVDLTTGTRTNIASQGFSQPQGLLVDTSGDIFVSDDSANLIKEVIPSR
jgi:DNA-binding beta-propeller fold protein YncE